EHAEAIQWWRSRI
ncbi:flagellar biosynthesis regulator FlhF domain protein, partial [Vibrio parahaemolyticus AQ3810]